MFRNKKSRYITLAIALVITVAGSITALAASERTTTATLYYNDISVVLDGDELTLTNADGGIIEPFVIDGTTYLPVRAIGEALGLSVQWNGDSNTVYLSSDSTEDSSTGEVVDMYTLTAYEGIGDFVLGDIFENRQQEYSPDNMLYGFDGTSILGWTKDEVPSNFSVTYLLDGQYTTFQAFAAPIDDQGSATFKFQDGDTFKELKTVSLASGDKPVQISIDVTGLDKLRILYSVSPHKFANSGYYYGENNGALYNAYLVK